MTRALTATEIQLLQKAQALAQTGDAAGAQAIIRQVLRAVPEHPDVLNLLAFVFAAQAQLVQARDTLELALKTAPRHPPLWNSLGRVLSDMGEDDAALKALDRAVALAPAYGDAWINLGVTALAAQQWARASTALMQGAQLHPKRADVWSALGKAELELRQYEGSTRALRTAIQLNPADGVAAHHLAIALRQQDLPVEARAVLAPAIAQDTRSSETLSLQAHLLADLGLTAEAISAYQAIIAQHPTHLDAHESLARLLPTQEQGVNALKSYHSALAVVPEYQPLWDSALRAARDLQAYDQLRSWASAAQKLYGPHYNYRLAQAAADALGGDAEAAIEPLKQMIADDPSATSAHIYLAHVYLKLGRAAAAQTHALAATQLSPLDQTGWALLTLIWRVLQDPREHWLADYERLVMPIDIEAPPGYANRMAFLAELAATLTVMHTAISHPAEQSLRGGTQTRGILFERRTPILQALADQIHRQVTNALTKLPADPSHPFLGRLTADIAFAGSWSVRLAGEGFHISHIHPQGWLSSAFYVDVPAEVRADGSALPAGALAFGVPDAALGLELAPRRVEVPVAGRLVIFPSYLWHGTLPFSSSAHRLTVAFDAVPMMKPDSC